MSFDEADYRRASARLDIPVAHIKAISAVESAGETFWNLAGSLVVPVRFEAHWFGKLTGYRFNDTDPALSCRAWNPSLAARTRAGAWGQVEAARALDPDAANAATSWGAFQVMGFHWKRLGYVGVQAFVDSMSDRGDDGQMDAFAAFVDADDTLQHALKVGDWDTVETLYNGGGYGGAYAEKMRAAVAVYGGSATAAPPRPLMLNDRGPDVSALQRALGIDATGTFDDDTDAAIRIVQQTHGLTVDGIVGSMTRAALGI